MRSVRCESITALNRGLLLHFLVVRLLTNSCLSLVQSAALATFRVGPAVARVLFVEVRDELIHRDAGGVRLRLRLRIGNQIVAPFVVLL